MRLERSDVRNDSTAIDARIQKSNREFDPLE
jgi:hypothetical protein